MFSSALKSGGNLRGVFISIDKRTDCCQRKFLHLLSAFPHFLSSFHLIYPVPYPLLFFLYRLNLHICKMGSPRRTWGTVMESIKAVHGRAQSHGLGNWDFSSFPPFPPPFQGSHWQLGRLTTSQKEAQN